MREMYGIEYWYLAEELNRILSNKRFQKIQKIADGVYRLRFEKNDVICELGKGIYITKYDEGEINLVSLYICCVSLDKIYTNINTNPCYICVNPW